MKLYAQERPGMSRQVIAVISDGLVPPMIMAGTFTYIDFPPIVDKDFFRSEDGQLFPHNNIVAWDYIEDALPEFVKLRDKLTDEYYKERSNSK